MPARKRTTAGPTPVEAITHADKRANLPTSDASDFVDPEIDQPIPVRYPRDPTLDPQLVWKGKDALDGEDLVADAPAIYIQEKIDPRVIVEVSGSRKSPGPTEAKAETARNQWCAAVNNDGSYGRWGYVQIRTPAHEASLLDAAIDALYRDQPIIGLPA
jgi:hypothetical protein